MASKTTDFLEGMLIEFLGGLAQEGVRYLVSGAMDFIDPSRVAPAKSPRRVRSQSRIRAASSTPRARSKSRSRVTSRPAKSRSKSPNRVATSFPKVQGKARAR